MKVITYTDERGRNYQVELPREAPDSDVHMGIFLGPPDVVDSLELPEPFATDLHNQLHRRGIMTLDDIKKNPNGLEGALKSALKIDVQMLHNAYQTEEMDAIPIATNGSRPRR